MKHDSNAALQSLRSLKCFENEKKTFLQYMQFSIFIRIYYNNDYYL